MGRESQLQKNKPFQSLRSSTRERSVLERRKRVRDSVALSRVRLSIGIDFILAVWICFFYMQVHKMGEGWVPLDASSLTKGVFCMSLMSIFWFLSSVCLRWMDGWMRCGFKYVVRFWAGRYGVGWIETVVRVLLYTMAVSILVEENATRLLAGFVV